MRKPLLLRTFKTSASLHGFQLPPTEELNSRPDTDIITYYIPSRKQMLQAIYITSAEAEGSKRRAARLPT